MVEYALALFVVVLIAAAAYWLVGALRSNGNRTLDLVSSEYPCPSNHQTTRQP